MSHHVNFEDHVYGRIGNRTLNEAMAERVTERPNSIFLIFEDSDGKVNEVTYADFDARCLALAGGLAELGISKGDKVVLRLTTRVELLLAWFALLRLGAIAVPTNPSLTDEETSWATQFVDAVAVITEPAWLEMYLEIQELVPELRHIIAVSTGPENYSENVLSFTDLEHPGRSFIPPSLAPDDVAEIIFTSGSTARPKGVMLTHANLLHSGERQSSMRALDVSVRCLTALPWFHVNCQCVTVLAALAVGGTAILLESYSASRFMEQVRRHRATQVTLGSMLVRTLLAQPPSEVDGTHDVRRAFYGLPITEKEREDFEERFAMTLLNGYGLTEACAEVTGVPVFGPKNWPSIGLPVQDRIIRLVDDAGRGVRTGDVGEIQIWGQPGWTLMKGYYGDPAATAAAYQDGWLATGDLAYADAVGYIYFVGRKKEIIKRAGENISALEVEATLMSHPSVIDAAVVAAPDSIRDEAVWAYVIVSEKSVSGQHLIDHCAESLASFKVPSVVQFRTELPRTSVGKIDKVTLTRETRELVENNQ